MPQLCVDTREWVIFDFCSQHRICRSFDSANGGGVICISCVLKFSNWFVTVSRRYILMRGECRYACGELSQKIDYEMTTFVFGMEVVVILLVNFTS